MMTDIRDTLARLAALESDLRGVRQWVEEQLDTPPPIPPPIDPPDPIPPPEPIPDPDPVPVPAPTPDPTPTPIPPSVGDVIQVRTLDMSAINLTFGPGYSHDGTYRRNTSPQVVRGDIYEGVWKSRNRVTYVPWDPVGPWTVALQGVDSVRELAIVVEPGSDQFVTFGLPQDLPDGWYQIAITSEAGESIYPEWILLDRHGNAPSIMPVWTGSYDHQHITHGKYVEAWVPARLSPTPIPLERREFVADGSRLDYKQLHGRALVLPVTGELHIPSKTTDGHVSTRNRQNYWSNDINLRYPVNPCFDGPRGVGTLSFPTWLRPHGPGGAVDFVMSGNRIGFLGDDGAITTLCGWRDVGDFARHIADGRPLPDEPEMVGDWSGVNPVGIQGGCWAAPFDTRTTEARAEITQAQIDAGLRGVKGPSGLIERHTGNVVQYANDAWGNRILRIEYDALQLPALPPKNGGKVSVLDIRWEDGSRVRLDDPWTCEFTAGRLYISDRNNNRILEVEVSEDGTEATARTLIQGDGSYIQPSPGHGSKWAVQLPGEGYYAALDRIHAQNPLLISPEGLYGIEDPGGNSWLYFADPIGRRVKRIHLGSSRYIEPQIEHVCSLTDRVRNPAFAQIAVSDGTLLPWGTVFVADWLVRHPACYLPDGTPHAWARGGPGWGPGMAGPPLGYSFGVGVRRGRCVFGGSAEGLTEVSVAAGDDLNTWDAEAVQRGAAAWHSSGRWLAYPYGRSYSGSPLPTVSADVRAFLQSCGTWT